MPTRSSQRFRRWRRYTHITVRGLIALVVVMALGFAWEAHRTRIQRTAVATIRAADGSVRYNWQWKAGEPVPDAKPPAPQQDADRPAKVYKPETPVAVLTLGELA